MNEKRVTIYDIAEKAGVSVGTVNRALNGKGRISEQTRERILDIAKELGYTVNAAAQGLRRAPIKIGAILFCPIDEYVDAIIEGMEYTAQGQETKIKRRLNARYREKRRENKKPFIPYHGTKGKTSAIPPKLT